MTVIDKMINDYAAKGFKAMCRADGSLLLWKDKEGIRKFSSPLEKKLAGRVERYLDDDNDWMLYNEKTGQVLIAEAQFSERMHVCGFDVWELCKKDKTVS